MKLAMDMARRPIHSDELKPVLETRFGLRFGWAHLQVWICGRCNLNLYKKFW